MLKMKTNYQYTINLIIILCIIRPHFTFLPDVLSVYIFDLLILLILFYKRECKIRINKINVISITFFFVILIFKSILGYTDFGTCFDLCKFVYYLLFFELFSSMLIHSSYSNKEFEKVLEICFYINLLIAVIQLLDIPFINSLVHVLYGTEKLRTLWSGYPRVYGTFFNANWFGVYVVFMIGFYTYRFCVNNKTLKYCINIIICIFLVLICASRTAMIASVVVVMGIMMLFKDFNKFIKISVIIISLGTVIIVVASQSQLYARTFMRFVSFFSEVHDSKDISSLAGSRYEAWKVSWPLFLESPVIGGKIGDVLPHNSYIAFLIEFGMLGVFSIMLVIINLAFKLNTLRRKSKYKIFLLVYSLALLVVMMGGEYLFCTQIMLLEIILLAVVFKYQEYQKGVYQ